jgi:hypothetical protein
VEGGGRFGSEGVKMIFDEKMFIEWNFGWFVRIVDGCRKYLN